MAVRLWSKVLPALSLLGVLTGVSLALAPHAQADSRGWVLTQRSSNFGDAYIYISPEGLRMVSPKMGCTIVTCAPGWAVTFYNERTRQYYTSTFEKWNQEVTQRMQSRGQSLADRPWSRGGISGVAGLKATQFSIRNASVGSRAGHRQQVSAADCWVADEIQVPHQISEMISHTYGLPNTRSFPLRISLVQNGAPTVALDTYRSQTCAIPTTYFGVPQGFTRVSSQAEVMMDDETKQIFNDMASDQPGLSSGNNASVAPQPVQTYSQPTGATSSGYQQSPYGSTATSTGSAASSAQTNNPTIQLPGGMTLDREKLQKIKEALMKGNK